MADTLVLRGSLNRISNTSGIYTTLLTVPVILVVILEYFWYLLVVPVLKKNASKVADKLLLLTSPFFRHNLTL
jgi:hypothetical protein